MILQISVEIIGSILNLGIETTFIGGLVLEVHGDACTGAVALGTGGVAYIFNLLISFHPENFNGTIFILLVILNLFMGKISTVYYLRTMNTAAVTC